MRTVGNPFAVTLTSNRCRYPELTLWEVATFSLHTYSLMRMCACRGLDTKRDGVLSESGFRRRHGLFTLYYRRSFDAMFRQRGS